MTTGLSLKDLGEQIMLKMDMAWCHNAYSHNDWDIALLRPLQS